MKLIDANALVLLVVGLIDENLVNRHPKTSIYSKKDFYKLLKIIGSLEDLIVLPNVWTELDNLLNRFGGNHKFQYIERLKMLTQQTTERFIHSRIAVQREEFWELGITDVLLLQMGKECELLITSDSTLSDFAKAQNIKVFDLKEQKNIDLK